MRHATVAAYDPDRRCHFTATKNGSCHLTQNGLSSSKRSGSSTLFSIDVMLSQMHRADGLPQCGLRHLFDVGTDIGI